MSVEAFDAIEFHQRIGQRAGIRVSGGEIIRLEFVLRDHHAPMGVMK